MNYLEKYENRMREAASMPVVMTLKEKTFYLTRMDKLQYKAKLLLKRDKLQIANDILASSMEQRRSVWFSGNNSEKSFY